PAVQRTADDRRSLDEKHSSCEHEHEKGPSIQRKAETSTETSREKTSVSHEGKSASSAKGRENVSSQNRTSRADPAIAAGSRDHHSLHPTHRSTAAPVQRKASHVAKPAPPIRNDVLEREAN